MREMVRADGAGEAFCKSSFHSKRGFRLVPSDVELMKLGRKAAARASSRVQYLRRKGRVSGDLGERSVQLEDALFGEDLWQKSMRGLRRQLKDYPVPVVRWLGFVGVLPERVWCWQESRNGWIFFETVKS